jgi:hypothetical protein
MVKCNEKAYWIKNQCQQITSTVQSSLSETWVEMVLRTTLSWRAPGRGQIDNFWLKQLSATHTHLAAPFLKID